MVSNSVLNDYPGAPPLVLKAESLAEFDLAGGNLLSVLFRRVDDLENFINLEDPTRI